MTLQQVKLKDLDSQSLRQLQEQYAGRDIAVEIKLASEKAHQISDSEMNEDKFWNIIALFDWEKQGNDDAVVEPAIQSLTQLSASAILTFYDLLSEKLYLLDGRVYAEASTNEAGDVSSDLFLYGRCAVVANGRPLFEKVLKTPEAFPKDLFFDVLLNVPERAWFRKTGKNLEYIPKYIYETGFNPHGWGAATISL